MNQIVVDNISFRYNKHQDYILKNICLEISQDDFILLNGANGAGKTTFISLILGLLTPTAGKISCKNGKLKEQFNYIPQKGYFHSVPMKAVDVVTSSFISSKSFFFTGYKQQQQKAWDMLEKLYLQDLGEKEFSSLSGGQAQKILMARALVNPAPFIFLDEPFSNMDEESQHFMMDRLVEQKGKSGIVMISHDMDLIADHQGKFCYLKQGKLTTYGNIQDMENSFFHTHTHNCNFPEEVS